MKYAVLFSEGSPEEGRSWKIVEAETPAQAAEVAGGHSISTDDKAYVVAIENRGLIVVYAKVMWAE
jgi:hypothetical protein